MGTKLTFPPLPHGYRWNLLNKINYKIGKWPGTATPRLATYIEFIEDLTQEEIDDVNAIMADPDTAQNAIQFGRPGNCLIIKDVWEWRDQVEADAGFNVAITYRSSGEKGSAFDEIVLQATDPTYQDEKSLNNPERKNFMAAVQGLIREE